MKQNTFLLIILLVLLSCNSQDPKGISNELYTISKDEIDLQFNSKYRAEDLKDIKMSLDSFGIYIIYDSLRFDDIGCLKHISARIINTNENSKSSVSSGSRELTEEAAVGFKYTKYTPGHE